MTVKGRSLFFRFGYLKINYCLDPAIAMFSPEPEAAPPLVLFVNSSIINSPLINESDFKYVNFLLKKQVFR
jgi:hypothetical protein